MRYASPDHNIPAAFLYAVQAGDVRKIHQNGAFFFPARFLQDKVRAAGDDPREYVEITFKVPERAYAAWPERIRNAFEPARTVRTGKPTYRLTICTERELRDGGIAIPFTGGIG